ncbi:menaquinol-cytochrome c reductase cytochrome b/c subunit [Paenibacillus apiarius]|uniref:C-type cytochrome n=1 Tax=Paenibacillus apiarius TaxID=46240 RepID=A0ABT4DSC0_9BACL|nr:menaquinol-cytochrome c reductase cytochrome b/c subunit [Paenibacillus apiarius]MCY9517089.1 c-type cytochrome [Paenibacillus apiarius]MCY9520214.1 c-type cytochrome [Paenibacillus apiarius]MCY9554898.1 c-type cytochrome [Paenibacillus apiarius]MCY9561409.1 c-type cytochrome [Paenibacillus apiarius]MCY9685931.1 c-type cytochrome [Paenibacillus apiarius]
MAHGKSKDEKVVYVGDSRIKKKDIHVTPQDYTSYPGKSEAFIPNFLLKEWMVGVVALVAFLVLTISEPPPLGYPANPNNTGFVPIPDWYFLFLYQFLKYPYASGSYVVIGTVLIPGLAFGGLLLAPFLDTGKERRFYRRPIASSLMIVSLIACVYLTKVAWDGYNHELAELNIKPEHIEREEKAREAALAGKPTGQPKPDKSVAIVDKDDPAFANMKKATCLACHANDLKGASGPSLLGIGDTMNKDEILDVIKNGKGNMPPMVDSAKAQGLNDEDIEHIADWLAKQKAAQ